MDSGEASAKVLESVYRQLRDKYCNTQEQYEDVTKKYSPYNLVANFNSIVEELKTTN